jgi:hypothetical protein
MTPSATPPVLFIVFRRPGTTRRVFEAIAAARPSRLFVAADGPRDGREAAACEEVRRIATAVTWPCELVTDFSERNLGSRDRPATALSWFFGQVDEGIVLEDDTLPSPDFFRFCAELLPRYRDDARIMQISGESYADRRAPYSYAFSKYPLTWGWASWRRAWAHFDSRLASWPAFREAPEFAALWDDRDEARYWRGVFQQVYEGRLPTAWDYAWWYACMTQGLSVRPAANLVSNIGGGAEATHTGDDVERMNRPVAPLDAPLAHPPWVVCDRAGDRDTWDRRFPGGLLKCQQTWRHQAGRPGRWLRRQVRAARRLYHS